MNNPMNTSPISKTPEQEIKPAYKGLHLVSRNDRPVPGPAKTTPARSLTLAPGRTSEAALPNDVLQTRSAESVRMKLAACFGAILTAPVVWCLHTLLLSFQPR